MKNKLKRTTSMLCALTVAAVPMTMSAFTASANDNTNTVSDYTLTIPASFDIKNEGWNEIGDISVTGKLADGRKLVVNAESDGEFALVNQSDNTQKIDYTLKNSAEGEETTSWEFEELSETPATQKIGVDVSPFRGMPAGSYTDTVTFTASVEDAVNIVDLSALTANYEAQDGDILTGTINGRAQPYKITVADGATITLKNAVINVVDGNNWAGITPNGNATIILEGENSVKCLDVDYPSIYVPEGKTLTIKGDGSLDASSNDYAAGIGGNSADSCGNIIIESGTITATGGKYAAGIGGGDLGSCGNITIANTVTKVTATKGANAPYSIGAGYNGTCGNVIIGGEKKGNISESPYTYQP